MLLQNNFKTIYHKYTSKNNQSEIDIYKTKYTYNKYYNIIDLD